MNAKNTFSILSVYSHLRRRAAPLLLLGCLSFLATGASAQFQNRTFRAASTGTSKHSAADGYRAMNACLQEKSEGKLKVQVFWDGALGTDLSTVQGMRTGTVDMVVTSTSPLTSIVPVMGVFDMPFLFNKAEEADQLLDGKVGDWFASQFPSTGLVILAWWENGFRHITNSKKAITKLEDFNGVKMRVMQSPVYLDTFKTLGSNAVPMAFSEVYSALETKTVDGQENPLMLIDDMKFYEVQKYLTLSRHNYSFMPALFSKKTWDSLSPQEQKVMRECTVAGRDVQRKANRVQESKGVDIMRSKGMVINELSPAELARIREQTQVIYERYTKTIGKQPFDLVFDELNRIRTK